MLAVENLDVAYRRSQVLFNVSMEVPAGGLVCVMGRNGVGKTTLLNTVMGVLKPSGGRVLWEGRDITSLRPHERIRAGIGYAPQGHPTFPQLTVAENLAVVVESAGRATSRRTPRCRGGTAAGGCQVGGGPHRRSAPSNRRRRLHTRPGRSWPRRLPVAATAVFPHVIVVDCEPRLEPAM